MKKRESERVREIVLSRKLFEEREKRGEDAYKGMRE